jgi:hypothetical protein
LRKEFGFRLLIPRDQNIGNNLCPPVWKKASEQPNIADSQCLLERPKYLDAGMQDDTQMKPIQISRESWILIAIGTADLCTTILWIRQGAAQEANPLFHYYWNQGLLAFIVAKYVCLLGPILVMEWARRSKPQFVQWALRAAVLAYVGLYGLGVVRLNSNRAQAEPHEDPYPNAVTEVIHGHNGKTHIIVRGLPDEFYTQPSPRQRMQAQYSRQRLQPAMKLPSAPSPSSLTFFLPLPPRTFH